MTHSPIAVIIAGAVVEAVAVMAPVVTGRSEHTFDRSHGAADAGADCAPNHPADGPCDPAAFIGALLGAADAALAVSGVGDEKQGQRKRDACENERPRSPRRGHARNLGLIHLDSLKTGGKSRR